ncbi:hypothetical protein Fmac_032685 [Flemingia macrophylla]|uniref:PPM-type phosphatase domain-containing protein n=1 Tax=Flemingia macrophylla TaxID=520843 RepID=A0ABD1L5N9_9FABA
MQDRTSVENIVLRRHTNPDAAASNGKPLPPITEKRGGKKEADKEMQAHNLSKDHKPDLEVEKDRILKASGFIQVGRVNGSLNLARAIDYGNIPGLDIIFLLGGYFYHTSYDTVERLMYVSWELGLVQDI